MRYIEKIALDYSKEDADFDGKFFSPEEITRVAFISGFRAAREMAATSVKKPIKVEGKIFNRFAIELDKARPPIVIQDFLSDRVSVIGEEEV